MTEETHSVKRAIIMAAGIGQRMKPLTLEIPKPLIKVNGVSMIDTVVDALRQNGIAEIYVVVGYLKEQFYEWAEKRHGVEIIENPFYDTCNNISSLYAARDHLEDCMIIDGDQMIYNPEILSREFSLSGYNAVWCDGETNEWLMTVENGIVTRKWNLKAETVRFTGTMWRCSVISTRIRWEYGRWRNPISLRSTAFRSLPASITVTINIFPIRQRRPAGADAADAGGFSGR